MRARRGLALGSDASVVLVELRAIETIESGVLVAGATRRTEA
jgi:hypothetical protein